VPVRDPQLRMLTFDVSDLVDARTEAARAPRSRHVVAFAQVSGERREPLFVSDETARILERSDGTLTALEIATETGTDNQSEGVRRGLRQIEELFVSGLLWLHEGRLDRSESDRPDAIQTCGSAIA
jgi:hypothetical protein